MLLIKLIPRLKQPKLLAANYVSYDDDFDDFSYEKIKEFSKDKVAVIPFFY